MQFIIRNARECSPDLAPVVITFATGCAWRAVYLHRRQDNGGGVFSMGRQIARLCFDPTASPGASLSGALGARSFRWYLPTVTWGIARRSRVALWTYNVQGRALSYLDGRNAAKRRAARAGGAL